MLNPNFQSRSGTRTSAEFGVRIEALHPDNFPPVIKDEQFVSQASRNFLFDQNFFQLDGPRSNPVAISCPPIPHSEPMAGEIEENRAWHLRPALLLSS